MEFPCWFITGGVDMSEMIIDKDLKKEVEIKIDDVCMSFKDNEGNDVQALNQIGRASCRERVSSPV